jgi:hypothetical protein
MVVVVVVVVVVCVGKRKLLQGGDTIINGNQDDMERRTRQIKIRELAGRLLCNQLLSLHPFSLFISPSLFSHLSPRGRTFLK